MVTERELRASSQLVRSQAGVVGDVARSLPGWIAYTGLVGGTFQPLIAAGVVTELGCAESLVDALTGLADDLDRRASEIAEYRRQLAVWRTDRSAWEQRTARHLIAAGIGIPVEPPGAPPIAPHPPFPEAEVS